MRQYRLDFTQIGIKDRFRPYFEIIIRNENTGKEIKTFGLLDTGADESALPGFYAKILGHDLDKGNKKEIMVAGGKTEAFRHTNKFLIPKIGLIKDILIDFIPNLHIPIIGLNIIENYNVFLYYQNRYFVMEDFR